MEDDTMICSCHQNGGKKIHNYFILEVRHNYTIFHNFIILDVLKPLINFTDDVTSRIQLSNMHLQRISEPFDHQSFPFKLFDQKRSVRMARKMFFHNQSKFQFRNKK